MVLVGIGGMFGALVRYRLGKYMARRSAHPFPVDTFLINVTGAFLLGLIVTVDTGGRSYLLLGDGFLGAYTTFSTFMYEGFRLFSDRKVMNAVTYLAGSILFGVLAYGAGFWIASSLR